MVHPPDQPRGKRRASHGAAIAPPAPQGGALDEDEEGFVDGNGTSQKRVRTEQSPSVPQEMYIKIMNEPPPLGLRLKKSRSFVDLIQACLAKENSTMDRSAAKNIISKPLLKKATKSGALKIGERVKASNFPANFLKIGNWEYKSQYEGDLVAKCYFAKHKLVWEVLNDGLKSKIEVEWIYITALKATCPKEGDGTLELMLSRPPVFFEETDPQPRKHTLWLAAPDFTDGQASMCRRHILRCSSSLLSKNFEKLIQSDKRLNELSRQPSIMSDSLFFGTISSIFEIPTVSGGSSSKSAHPVSLCNVSSVFERHGVKHHQPLNLGAAVVDVQAGVVPQEPKNLNLCNQANPELPKEIQEIAPSSKSAHPVSLCNASSVFEKGGVKHHQPLNLGAPVLDVQPEVVHQEPKNLNLCNQANPELPKEIQEIADSLLGDTQGPPPSADEKYVLARVDSLNNLLKKDAAPSTISIPERNDIIIAGEAGYDAFDEELEFHFEDEEIWAPIMRTVYGSTGPPAISTRDSLVHPLENLPRIDSMPQFLFDIAED